MGQIRKINDLYYIDFTSRGLLYSQVAGNDFEEAQRLLLQVESKIASGEALTMARHIDLPDFHDRFLSYAREQYGLKTAKRYAVTIDHFNNFLKSDFPRLKQLAQLTPSIVESYKIYLVRSQKAKIVNLTILLIRDILDFGIKLGFLNDNPSLHVRLLPWPKTLERKPTSRFNLANQLTAQGAGLGKMAQLLKFKDIARAIYFADSIPISREDVYS